MGLLDLFDDDENPFYIVGQRALNSAGGGSAYKASPGIGHEHFIRNDRAENFGFGPTGIFAEQPSALEEYELTPKYGAKRYDAALLEQILRQWPEKNAAIEQVVEDMGLQEYVFPHMYQEYSLPLNNCKDFVRDFDYRYRLAGGKFQ